MNPEAIVNLLNRYLIVANGFIISHVAYAPANQCFFFWYAGDDDSNIIIPRDNLGIADWDEEDESETRFDTTFYTIVDAFDIHHLVKFYRNDSQEIMRQVKELL